MIISCSITWHVPTSLSLHTLSIEVSIRVSSIIQNQTRAFNRLNKSAHFIPVKTRYRPPEYVDLCIAEIVKLHGIPKTIISDRGPQFTAHFWERMHKSFGTSLVRSIAYHPQTLGQTERLNQVLEDMLRACVLSSKGSSEAWLPLAKFSYNNGYQESIKMAPFEALYGRKCRTLLNYVEPGERRYYGIDFVNEAREKVQIILLTVLKYQI